jgi:hypothetical protein
MLLVPFGEECCVFCQNGGVDNCWCSMESLEDCVFIVDKQYVDHT